MSWLDVIMSMLGGAVLAVGALAAAIEIGAALYRREQRIERERVAALRAEREAAMDRQMLDIQSVFVDEPTRQMRVVRGCDG